jgi:hypothetical protein
MKIHAKTRKNYIFHVKNKIHRSVLWPHGLNDRKGKGEMVHGPLIYSKYRGSHFTLANPIKSFIAA